jgi:hypothetical protein
MFPHPESGIRAQSTLSSVCHAAQAAVGRHTKTARNKTTIADVIGYTLRRKPAKFYSFDLDLQNDLVCFGPPDADWDGPACFGVPGAVKDHQPAGLYASPWPCTQIAGAVRKFAMRCTPGWEYSAEGLSKILEGDCLHEPHSKRPDVILLGFCSGCMLRFLGAFKWLDELYFILDEAGVQGELGEGNGDAERRSPSVGREVYTSYSRTYFEVDMSADSAGVGILERLRSKLVSYNRMRR